MSGQRKHAEITVSKQINRQRENVEITDETRDVTIHEQKVIFKHTMQAQYTVLNASLKNSIDIRHIVSRLHNVNNAYFFTQSST